jgi:hypothetical protein
MVITPTDERPAQARAVARLLLDTLRAEGATEASNNSRSKKKT